MDRYEIPMADYIKALSEASDAGYRAHLVNDFTVTPDGRVLAKLHLDKRDDRDYILHI